MTIHELYNQKQQQFMQYQVDKGVYDAKLRDAQGELLKAARELQGSLELVDNPAIKSALVEVTNTITSENFEYSENNLLAVKSQIDTVANNLESEIRAVLNG